MIFPFYKPDWSLNIQNKLYSDEIIFFLSIIQLHINEKKTVIRLVSPQYTRDDVTYSTNYLICCFNENQFCVFEERYFKQKP